MPDTNPERTHEIAEQARDREGTGQMTVQEAGVITKDLIEKGKEKEQGNR